jgi:hypothetical protein
MIKCLNTHIINTITINRLPWLQKVDIIFTSDIKIMQIKILFE